MRGSAAGGLFTVDQPLLAAAIAAHLLALLCPAAGVGLDQRARSRGVELLHLAAGSSHHGPSNSDAGSGLRGMSLLEPAPPLTPEQYLLVSSPAHSKIVYTRMSNFKAKSGLARALVDSGLSRPRGLAFDRTHGYLYVADAGASKIFRYRLLMTEESNGQRTLTTDGVQLVILEGHEVDWVASDINGDLFFSDKEKRYIGHIPYDTVDLIAKGEASPSNLEVVSQSQLQEEAVAKEAELAANGSALMSEPAAVRAQLLTLYEADHTKSLHAPSGVASDGIRIYWGNELGGAKYGSVVRGESSPTSVMPDTSDQDDQNVEEGEASFPTVPLAYNANFTYGVARSSKLVLFSSDGGPNGTQPGFVYGVADSPTGKSAVFALASTLVSPRGLCWDGDQTVYVADEGANSVYSMPVGRLADNVPLEFSVSVVGPYGVAMFSENDPWLVSGTSGFRGLSAARQAAWLCSLVAALLSTAAPRQLS